MKNLKLSTLIISLLLGVLDLSHADFLDQLGLTQKKSTNQTAGSTSALTALSQDQMAGGLKEALGKGVERAISQLGHSGGFLTNLNVKIPMPEKLRTVEKTLRTLKQEKLADDFVNTMNHAAEQAVPEAANVFGDAIKQMTFADAKAILSGTNNAATEFFRKTTSTSLNAKFLPIVKQATSKAGVTAAYKNMMSKVSGADTLGGALGGFINQDAMDIDSYVTKRAMDGLFKMVADEEKRIRENPVARTTDLLQKVFGAATK